MVVSKSYFVYLPYAFPRALRLVQASFGLFAQQSLCKELWVFLNSEEKALPVDSLAVWRCNSLAGRI